MWGTDKAPALLAGGSPADLHHDYSHSAVLPDGWGPPYSEQGVMLSGMRTAEATPWATHLPTTWLGRFQSLHRCIAASVLCGASA